MSQHSTCLSLDKNTYPFTNIFHVKHMSQHSIYRLIWQTTWLFAFVWVEWVESSMNHYSISWIEYELNRVWVEWVESSILLALCMSWIEFHTILWSTNRRSPVSIKELSTAGKCTAVKNTPVQFCTSSKLSSLSLGETLLYMKGVAGVPIYTSLVQPKA